VPDESEFPCVWLPYKVYKIEVTTEAWSNPTRADGGDERKVECETGDSILGEEMTETRYFKTQGPPLDLTPYVHEVLPASATRPFFRRYDPAVRFKTNYIRELYTLPGRDAGVKVCEGEPGLIARLLDSSRNFLSECDVYFTKAEDHVEPLYDGSGVPGPDAVFLERQPEEFAELYRDDILHVDCDTAVLRPGERHVVQIVWRDPRLRDDLRFDPDDPEVEEVVVLEFPLLASRFEWLDEVFRTFLDDATCPAKGCSGGAVYRGTYFELEVPKGANWGAAAEVLDELADAGSVVGPFAARLRDAHPTAVPGEVDDQTLRVWLAGVERPVQCLDAAPGPGCDEKVLAPADALGEVREAWEHERAAFDRLDRLLRLERHREPLPGGLEVSVLESDGEWMGFLLEFPEPLDLSRITIFPELDGASPEPPLRVVKDAPGARIFLFSHEAGDGGGIFPPGAGEWRLSMVLQGTPDGELDGWRVTGLRRGPGPQFPETPAVCFHLGTDLFGAPCPE
jgi:hypothetical protein